MPQLPSLPLILLFIYFLLFLILIIFIILHQMKCLNDEIQPFPYLIIIFPQLVDASIPDYCKSILNLLFPNPIINLIIHPITLLNLLHHLHSIHLILL